MKLLKFVFALTIIVLRFDHFVNCKPSHADLKFEEKNAGNITDDSVEDVNDPIEYPEKVVNINLKNEGGLKITYPNGEIFVPSERKNVHIKTIDVFEEKDRNPSESFNRKEKDEKLIGQGRQGYYSENAFFPIYYNYYYNQAEELKVQENKPFLNKDPNFVPGIPLYNSYRPYQEAGTSIKYPNPQAPASSYGPHFQPSQNDLASPELPNYSKRNQYISYKNTEVGESTTEKPSIFKSILRLFFKENDFRLKKISLKELILALLKNVTQIITNITTLQYFSVLTNMYNIIEAFLSYFYGSEGEACVTKVGS